MFQTMILCTLVIAVVVVIQSIKYFSERILLQRFLSALILMVSYVLLPSQAHYLKVSFDKMNATLYASAVISLIAMISTGLAIRQPSEPKAYPQLKPRQWTTKLVLLNGLSWSVYLMSYEILFRGYLLFSCMEENTFAISMLINLVIYAIAHLHKSEKEFLLSIPFGAILCYLVYITGNVWPAVFGHIVLALSIDFFSHRASRKVIPENYKMV
jgi:membrane protease YdiL (CAAX protease family)